MEESLRTFRRLPTVDAWFDRMADSAIRGSFLCVGEIQFAIVETEFYFHAEGHDDPFVHCSQRQLTRGEWYFHREKAAKIGFTLKGIDLTFGDRDHGEYGGMLIRAIACPDGSRIVEGPSKVVDTILTTAGVTSVAGLKALPGYSDQALVPASYLRFAARAEPWGEVIRAARRIGLRGTSPYAEATYRYRARPALTSKDRAEITRGRLVRSNEEPRVVLITATPMADDAKVKALSDLPAPPAPPAPPVRLSDDDIDALLADMAPAENSEQLAEDSEQLAEDSEPRESWGIVGYRHFTDYPRFVSELKEVVEQAHGTPKRVVSGGAVGTDSMAAQWARENGIQLVEHLPRSSRAEDLLARNTLIVRDSSIVIAFLSRESRGTRDTITKARKRGVPVIVINVD